MPIKNTSVSLRNSGLIGALIYFILIIHDSVLYPHLDVIGILELAGLRWVLLALPIVGTIGMMNVKGVSRFLGGALWLTFIPYTLYSLLEVRHIAEICRLQDGYFTQYCPQSTWQILPSLFYGLVGLAIFTYSVNALTSRRSRLSAFFLTTVTALYSAVASAFGIFTRLNVWDVIVVPSVASRYTYLLGDSSFWVNVLMLWLMFTLASNLSVFWLRTEK